jgi:hypothetical protein
VSAKLVGTFENNGAGVSSVRFGSVDIPPDFQYEVVRLRQRLDALQFYALIKE